MSTEIRVFVNQRGYTLASGATVRDAVAAAAPELVAPLESGDAQVTDARGLPVDLDMPLPAGSILRASRSSRRAASSEPDAG
jgi:hypothetical protein